jgi:hypothetical protein
MAVLSPSARLLRALVALSCSFPLVQACGGRSDTEDYLYGSDDISLGGTAGSAAVGGSRPIGTAGSPIGTSGVGASSATGGSQGVGGAATTGGVGTGGSIGTAGFGAVAGTTSVAGAAGAPSGPPITCGADVCDSASESCCAGLAGLSCVAKGQTCAGAVLGCTTNADCGMGICCISITGEVSAASSCKPQCDTGTTRDRQLCQVDADCRMPFRFCTPTIFGVNICTRRP